MPILPATHQLKTDGAVFDAVAQRLKTYELRYDDRGYLVGDGLLLCKTKYTGAEMAAGAPLEYTGDTISCKVIHVLKGPIYGLLDGWCLMSLEILEKNIERLSEE